MGNLTIPTWVSYRSYATPEEFRSIITNEKVHETFFLEGESSKIWGYLEGGDTDLETLVSRASDDCIDVSEDEVREFLDQLINDQLLLDTDKNHLDPIRLPKGPPTTERLENSTLLSEMRPFMSWLVENGFLYSVHWEITWRCNEKCIHCYNPGAAHFDDEKHNRETDELNLDQIKSVLVDLKKIGVAKITFSGGDPFVRKDFFEILEAARGMGFIVDVYTNALLLKPKAMDKLLALYPSCVGVSVYSANSEAHDAITKVPGSFDKSTKALKRLNQAGVRTAMKAVQMQQTVHGWRDTQKLAHELGAGAEIDFGLTAGADGAQAPLDHAITDFKHLIIVALSPDSPLYVGSKDTGFNAIVRDPKSSVCGAGISSIGIDPEGSVVPCLSLPLVSGSLKEQSIVDIWHARHGKGTTAIGSSDKPSLNEGRKAITSAEPESVLARWSQITLKDYRECGTHDRCIWCQRCPGMSMSETGNPLNPSSTNCRTAAARMLAASLTLSGVTHSEACELFDLSYAFGSQADEYIPPVSHQKSDQSFGQFDPREAGLRAIGCGSCGDSCHGSAEVDLSNLITSTEHRGSEAIAEASRLADELGISSFMNRENFIQ